MVTESGAKRGGIEKRKSPVGSGCWPSNDRRKEDRDEGHGWDLVFRGINSAGHRVGTSEMAKRGRAGDVDSIFMTFPLENQTFRESQATTSPHFRRGSRNLNNNDTIRNYQESHFPSTRESSTSAREWKRMCVCVCVCNLFYLSSEFSTMLLDLLYS